MNCIDCSKCCQNIILPIAVSPNADQIRWIELHDVEVVKIRGITHLKINQPCNKLNDNKCSIYNKRPQVCKDYTCQEFKEFV